MIFKWFHAPVESVGHMKNLIYMLKSRIFVEKCDVNLHGLQGFKNIFTLKKGTSVGIETVK